MSHSHTTHVFSIEKMKPDSWKIRSDFHRSLWTLPFLKLHTFSLSKTRKMRRNVMRAEVMIFTFLLSLKSEVADDIAHWLHGTQSVRLGAMWVSERQYPSANEAIFFVCYFLHAVNTVTNKIHFTLEKSNRSSHFPMRIILVLNTFLSSSTPSLTCRGLTCARWSHDAINSLMKH